MKMLPAICEDGVVKIEGVPIAGAEILSDGVGESEGVAIIQRDAVTYIVMNTSDLKLLIDSVVELTGKVVEAINSIASGMTGPTTAPPGGLATIVTALQGISDDIEGIGENLK